MEEFITKEEYQEKIIKMINSIENLKILRYLFIVVHDIIEEK